MAIPFFRKIAPPDNRRPIPKIGLKSSESNDMGISEKCYLLALDYLIYCTYMRGLNISDIYLVLF